MPRRAHDSSMPSAVGMRASARKPTRSRYELLLKIGSGGMATVYVGRLRDAHDSSRLVAVKRAHAHLVQDAEFHQMLIAEARLASRFHHSNVVSVHDVEELDDDLLLVMDYVEGASLSDLAAAGVPLPPGLVVRMALDACAGLDAAHELRDENGKSLGLVHRDVSPQNILVGVDGVSRITDFGIAKLASSRPASAVNALKGKPGYMAPEYIARGEVGRRGDVFAMGVVVWEAFAGRRLFQGATELDTISLVTTTDAAPLSTVASDLRPLDAPLRRALARHSPDRYPTMAEFASDLGAAARAARLEASHAEVSSYVRSVVSEELERRRALLRGRLEPAASGQPITAQIAVGRGADVGGVQSRSPADILQQSVGSASSSRTRVIGRYALHGEIAHGGMATVHFGRLLGAAGFAKTVAIKRLHPQFAKDPEFVAMFLDEARLAARIRHPNVVSTLDVVAKEGELFLVMEYMPGESLGSLLRKAEKRGIRVPPNVVASVMAGVLHGLHAAHEARGERGEPIDIVHRDVSPQNILVGSDGIARVLDFGVAKAAGRMHTTRDGQVKGKLAYMSPEQLTGSVSRATDIWAASVVLWEALVGQRLFPGQSEGETVRRVLDQPIEPPSKLVPGLPGTLDELTLRGLSRNPAERFESAREMAKELERALPLAPTSAVGDFVEEVAGAALAERAERVVRIESSVSSETASDSVGELPAAVSNALPSPTLEPSVEEPATAVSEPSQPPIGVEIQALRRRKMKRIVASVAGVSAVPMLVALGLSVGARRAPDSAPAASSSVALPAETTSAPTVVFASKVEPASSPTPAPTPSRSSALAPRPALKPPQGRKPKPNCNPSFTLDSAGDKHFKPECY